MPMHAENGQGDFGQIDINAISDRLIKNFDILSPVIFKAEVTETASDKLIAEEEGGSPRVVRRNVDYVQDGSNFAY